MEAPKEGKSFTLETSLEAAKKGSLGKWVNGFLEGIGNNPELARGIRHHDQRFIGPVLVPLKGLHRIAGPEREMKYSIPKESWEKEVSAMRDLLSRGWKPPPLIVVDFFPKYNQLADGNRRHQALSQEGVSDYWVIFCSAD